MGMQPRDGLAEEQARMTIYVHFKFYVDHVV